VIARRISIISPMGRASVAECRAAQRLAKTATATRRSPLDIPYAWAEKARLAI
jgi:hypothetical protein